MISKRIVTGLVVALTVISLAHGQEPAIPPGDKEPLLRLEAGGPTSFVTALAFSPDGKTLYAAGYDKVVRVWKLDPRSDAFALDRVTYRPPIGPGLDGAINALALSPDGDWLAVGGMGIVRGGAGFRRPGLVFSKDTRMTAAMWKDEGTIYAFNTRTRAVRVLRGHQGPVLALAFAPQHEGGPPLLISAAQERDMKAKAFVGGVRLWDLSKPASENPYVAGQWGLSLPNLETRPALAMWPTGKQPLQLMVAIAWGDGNLRLWDVAQNSDGVSKFEDGKYNNTAVYLPAAKQLLTGGMRGPDGRLLSWKTSGELEPDSQRQVAFASQGDVHFFPRALTLASSQAGGPLDLAAVILRVPARNEEYRLHLVDMSAENLGAVKVEIPLWHGGENLAVVAAAPGGRHVAIAGNKNHEIAVYGLADLLQGQRKPQLLRSAGSTFGDIALVTNQKKDIGLWLGAKPKPAPGSTPRQLNKDDQVFDFTRRGLTTAAGWQENTPDLTGWTVERAVAARDSQGLAARWSLTVRHNGETAGKAEVKARTITDFALLPPRPPLNVPLLAVAFLDDKMQPWLYLYNAHTGEQIRQYTGHTDLIRALAFSADGSLLASAADDQTVCVWSLTNLPTVLGKRGMLNGVGVKGKDAGLEVVYLDKESPASKDLKLGDFIEGLVDKGQARALKTPLDFFDTLSLIPPGGKATLRIRGKGDVAIPIRQAVDDRKPLLTLFITRGDKKDREWVGWNPNGQYDASDRRTERLIGWHFNTGRPEAPTSFALADQYRKDYYREGILRHLVVKGSLSGALKAWEEEDRRKPLPQPKTNVWSNPLGPDPKNRDGKGEILVRGPQDKLMVSIDDFPLGRLDSIRWQLDGQPSRDFNPGVGRERWADLSQLSWKQGQRYHFHVVIRTQEVEPQEIVKELVLRYQPPPPALINLPAAQTMVAKPEILLQGEVRPALADAPVIVKVAHFHDGQKLLDAVSSLMGLTFHQKVKLLPGVNRVEVTAVNKDALSGYEELETTHYVSVVTYQPPQETKAPAPKVALDHVTEAGQTAPLEIQPNKAVVVHSSRVQVLGAITAPRENLIKAVWIKGDAKAGSSLTKFKPDEKTQWTIAEDLALTPGLQTFRFLAKTATSAEGEDRLAIDYRPPLPQFQLQGPFPGMSFFDEGKGPPRVELIGRFALPNHPHPFTVEVLLNGKAVPHALDARHNLSAALALEPRHNRIQVIVKNEWKEAEVAEDIGINYLRPPRDIHFDKVGPVSEALVNLAARVHSDLPIARESIEAEVNGHDIPLDLITVKPDGGAWTLALDRLALDPGANVVRMRVRNAEAMCREPGTTTVVYTPPPKPLTPPEVEILDPPQDVKVTEPTLTVRFRVKSASPLERIELIQEGSTPFRETFDLSKEQPNAQGYYVLKRDLHLAARANPVRVEAINGGGGRHASVVVNYFHIPVQLTIDSLTPLRGDGRPITPRVLADGRLSLPPVPQGRLMLRGHVNWDQENDEQLGKINVARVFVNGFQQTPADLGPRNGRQRSFKTDILLNQAADNLVEVSLPDIPRDAGNRPEFHVACQHPEKGQRLHVLVVGVGEKNDKKLIEQTLSALRAKPSAGNLYATPAFAQVRLYGPLTGYVDADQVFTQLCLIKKTIDVLAGDGSSNDVVMVYFQGDESVKRSGHYFLTSASAFDKDLRRSAITCDGFANFFGETLGAQLLLLDVDRAGAGVLPASFEGTDQIVKWPMDSYVGVTRYLKLRQNAAAPILMNDLSDMMPRVTTWGDVVRLVREKTVGIDPTMMLVSQRLREPMQELTVSGNP